MHKIESAELFAKDRITNRVIKTIHSTKGEFWTGQLVYNPSLLNIEKTLKTYIKKELLNCKLVSTRPIYYPPNPILGQQYKGLKELTNSRLGKGIYGTDLYKNEVERIKYISSDSDMVDFYYMSLSMPEWGAVSKEDLLTFSLEQIEAGLPHVSVQMSPYQKATEYLDLIKEVMELKGTNQFINPVLHPSTYRREAANVLNHIALKDKNPTLTILGRSPNPVGHNLFYFGLLKKIPLSKVIICADCGSKYNSGLALSLGLKQFNMDLISPGVWFQRGRQPFIQTPPEKIEIYHDGTGGMLNDEKMLEWTGISVKDRVMANFPGWTGLDFQELVKAFNFIALNETGMIENEAIIDHQHKKYITNRTYLEAFYIENKNFLINN